MNRRTVPRNIERRLWAESIGYCMNPTCGQHLISGNSNIGEIAHVKPHSEGGSVDFKNLLLLCSICHKQIDDNRQEDTIEVLNSWKENRNKEIRARFFKAYTSLKELKSVVLPILKDNAQIFNSYGPCENSFTDHKRYELWLQFEGELISNNKKISLILKKNKKLFDEKDQDIIDKFILHTKEFIKTRDDSSIPRINLFPKELLSVFGIEPKDETRTPASVSALQNFIAQLVRENRFIELQLEPDQTLVYKERSEKCRLSFNDTRRMWHLFEDGNYFFPVTTKIRLKNLIFILGWLSRNNIHYKFIDFRDLTKLILNDEHTIKLYYEYCLSVSDLYDIGDEKDLIIVNLYNWNEKNCISLEAYKYAEEYGFKLFNQKSFFIFAHKNIK